MDLYQYLRSSFMLLAEDGNQDIIYEVVMWLRRAIITFSSGLLIINIVVIYKSTINHYDSKAIRVQYSEVVLVFVIVFLAGSNVCFASFLWL